MIADPTRASGRVSQLDGLRFLAFLAVFAHHADEARVPWGGLGVEFFFALSGFLITRILVGGESGRTSAATISGGPSGSSPSTT